MNDLTYTVYGETLKYISNCPICGEKSLPLKKTEIIPCPKCRANMKYTIVGFWD